MTALTIPTEEELDLWALLTDPSGLDLAEFSWFDAESETGCYRAWDFQHRWYRTEDAFQVDQGARALGKTVSITMRCCVLPFTHPGQGMLLTAPELNHLRPLTDAVESRLLTTRLLREMLPTTQSKGMVRQPHWQVKFRNGTSIISRLPNKDGKGVKGIHVLKIEMDECFPAGTMVTTRRGQVPIEDVVVGDQVITHRNRWRTVTDRFCRDRQVVSVRGQGHPGLVCSINHKFWGMRQENRLVWYGDNKIERERTFTDPGFIPASELDGAYWCSPTTFPKVKTGGIPALSGRRGPRSGYEPVVDVRNPSTYWMVGLYIAEGSVGSSQGIEFGPLDRLTFSIHQDEVSEVGDRFNKIGMDFSGPYPIKGGLGVNIVCYTSKITELANWLVKNFGKGARNKQIATWALGLPRECREELLAGLIYGDGYFDPDKNYLPGRMKLTTVSRGLMVSARLLGLSLDYSVSCHWSDVSNRKVMIRGREVNSDGFYQVVFTPIGQGILYKNRRYTAVREVTDLDEVQTLYDLTVDEDHTFIADGFIVSNSQNYPKAGWTEIVECLNRGLPGASFHCHGVPLGVRDNFWEITEGSKEDSDIQWHVHRPLAMMRPTWSAQERTEKERQYGGSRQHIDYKRNIYGEHGDASSAVLVLAKLNNCTDSDDSSVYNTDVYTRIQILLEELPDDVDDRRSMLRHLINLPAEHKHGWSQTRRGKEVGAPKGYESYWGGFDVGVTADPSEILICGQRRGTDKLDLLTRVHMQRINVDDQAFVVELLFDYYGIDLRALGVDSTGVGFPLDDHLSRDPKFGKRVYGFNFSSKVPVGFEDRELRGSETIKDLAIMRNMVEASTDWFRNDYIDAGKILLPWDRELLLELQSQTYMTAKDNGSPYGTRRVYSGGSFHTFDSLKTMMAAKYVPPLIAIMEDPGDDGPILAVFM